MTKSKKKYYVVWQGLSPGIYDTWAACKRQVKGVANAVYKSFATAAEAEEAFYSSPAAYIGRTKSQTSLPQSPNPVERAVDPLALPLGVTADALAVDAACSGNPGMMEYRGVYLRTGVEVFHYGPVFGTNNIGEFLAIVHALAFLKRQGRPLTVYSDSRNGLLWVRSKKCRTTLVRNVRTEELYQLIERAEQWLRDNDYADIRLCKWNTSEWGEIPADFGRKG